MKLSRRQLMSLLAATPAFPQTAGRSGDVVLQAMADEIARCKQLRVLSGNDPLYFVEYALDDAEGYSVGATLGALVSERRTRFRMPRVAVRVGSMEFDNTNYLLSDYYAGSRYDSDHVAIDDDYDALRQSFWLATDRAFKGAIEAIGRKRAALRNITQADKLPDFSAAPAVQKLIPTARVKVDEALWRPRVVAMSGIFAGYPEIHDSGVELDAMQSTAYLTNTESTSCALPDSLFSVKIRASGQSADGMRLRSHAEVHALDVRKLPIDTDLRRIAKSVADDLKALIAAPQGEQYTGPVLFEGTAAAQIFGEVLGGAVSATRKPVTEPSRPLNLPMSPFDGRIGSRVLPTSFTVVDDPLQSEWRTRPLIGTYPIDSEGVVPQPVTLVEKGIFKTFLSTRTPSKDASASNGRARLPGAFGAKAAAISNLFVSSSEGISGADLKAQFLKLVADRGKQYGIIVRKMDFPSTMPISDVRRYAHPQEKSTSLPMLVYRVYPDGREELVRGLRFRGFTARNMKDIVAASSELFAFDFLGNLAPFSLSGVGGYIYASTVVAPSILFEDLELETLDQDLPKLPIVSSPPSAAE